MAHSDYSPATLNNDAKQLIIERIVQLLCEYGLSQDAQAQILIELAKLGMNSFGEVPFESHAQVHHASNRSCYCV